VNHRTACIFADLSVSFGCATMAIRDAMTGHPIWACAFAAVAGANLCAAYMDFRFRNIRRAS
jgi:hypothetical protein